MPVFVPTIKDYDGQGRGLGKEQEAESREQGAGSHPPTRVLATKAGKRGGWDLG
jgi:hypothetical protein